MQFKWCASVKYRDDGSIISAYAYRRVPVAPYKQTSQKLHRFILGIDDPDVHVDHIDHDGLNCRDENLRISTRSQNLGNRRKNRNNTSGYKGVYWIKRLQKYQVYAAVNGKRKSRGMFTEIEDAARAYDVAAREEYGEFACLNFPKETENYEHLSGIC